MQSTNENQAEKPAEENSSPAKDRLAINKATKLDKRIMPGRVNSPEELKSIIENTERPADKVKAENSAGQSSGSSAQPQQQNSQQQNQSPNPQSNFGNANPNPSNCCNHSSPHNHANQCWADKGGQNHGCHPDKDHGHNEPKDPIEVAKNDNNQSEEQIEEQAKIPEPPRIEDSVPSNEAQEQMA